MEALNAKADTKLSSINDVPQCMMRQDISFAESLRLLDADCTAECRLEYRHDPVRDVIPNASHQCQLRQLHVAAVIAASRAAVLEEELYASQDELRVERERATALECHCCSLVLQLRNTVEANNRLEERMQDVATDTVVEDTRGVEHVLSISASASAAMNENGGVTSQKRTREVGEDFLTANSSPRTYRERLEYGGSWVLDEMWEAGDCDNLQQPTHTKRKRQF